MFKRIVGDSMAALDENTILAVVRLFETLNWNVPKSEHEYGLNRFDQFCKMLEPLNTREQALVIEITQRFIKIDSSVYSTILKNVLTKAVCDDRINSNDVIAFTPLVSPEDREKQKTKSSHLVYFLTKDDEIENIFYSREKKIQRLDNISALQRAADHNSTVVLLDDFIGTGETALSAIREITSKGIEINRLVVVTIAAHEIGIKALEENNIPIYFGQSISKGITDYYQEPVIQQKLSLMRDMEKKYQVSSNLSLGYCQSEALISLINTPNNTFPIYWYGERNGRNRNSIPFARS